MTLRRTRPLERRAGLTATTGIVRRATLPRARAGLPAGAGNRPDASPRRERRARLDVPAATREALRWRSGGRCEAALPDVCTGDASDVHHRQRRRDGGHAIVNLLDLCRACHAHAHAHPAEARELGLIVSVYEDPAVVAVVVRSRLVGRRRHVRLSPAGDYVLEEGPA